MISLDGLTSSEPVRNAEMFGLTDIPIYARLPSGVLTQIDGVSKAQIMTTAGAHDVIVLEISEKVSEEV